MVLRPEAEGALEFGNLEAGFNSAGGTRDRSPAIYRRIGHPYDLRPGGTLAPKGLEDSWRTVYFMIPRVETLG
jgi:hypothetical protein